MPKQCRPSAKCSPTSLSGSMYTGARAAVGHLADAYATGRFVFAFDNRSELVRGRQVNLISF